MDLAAAIGSLQKRALQHREVLATEEAAKNALVMPFLQALGYDVFNPEEVIPEFSADVGTKKGEKVDYAICRDGVLSILVECKPCSAELNINHAGQLFRYFSVTDARLALLTNGVNYQFYSDVENPNKMDDKPFFSFDLNTVKSADVKTLERFTKSNFDIDKIVLEAGNLKIQSLIRKELENEFSDPSVDFVRVIAGRIHSGKLTSSILEKYSKLTANSINTYIRDLVTDRLSSALKASGPADADAAAGEGIQEGEAVTTDEEIAGWQIIRAIAARLVDPKRVVIRDQKSYCAVLLDDNNRKAVARLHFNGTTTKYLGTFVDKVETRHAIADLPDIFQFEPQLLDRIKHLELASNVS